MTMEVSAPEYVSARRVLLDALTALEGHLDNLVLVGAQAVYQHAGEADLMVPMMTTDGDLAMDTRGLADAPEIGGLLRAAGFTPGPNPGHEKGTARITPGLEPALIDNAHVTIAALDPSDRRMTRLRVAGPAALLTAKAIKIGERLERSDDRPDRLKTMSTQPW